MAKITQKRKYHKNMQPIAQQLEIC